MSLKLSSLKKWLTLEDSAQYLSLLISEQVTPADLLQLATQNELTLSLSLPGRYWAVPYCESAPKEAASLGISGQADKVTPEYTARLLALVEYASFCIRQDEGEGRIVEKVGPDFRDGLTVSGIWDLSMLGAERELVTEMAGLPTSRAFELANNDRIENNKPIILAEHGEQQSLLGLFTVQDDPAPATTDEGLTLIGYGATKVQRFPADAFLVIRSENLQAIANRITGTQTTSNPPEQAGALPEDIDLLLTAWRTHWGNVTQRDLSSLPLKADVKQWLMEKGLSAKNADAGATMITPDWARKGGRR